MQKPKFESAELFLLLLLALVNFTHIVDFMIMMPLGPQLMRIFSLNPQQFSLLVSSYTFAAATSGLLAAFFMDRFDRKLSLLVFYLGFSLGTIVCAISKSYEVLLCARALTGAFGGVISSIVMSIVSDSIAPERRGSAMGIVMGSFSVATIFGVPFSLFLANHYEWHAPFMFLGVLAILIAVVIAQFLKPMRGHLRGLAVSNRDLFEPIRHVFESPSQMIALVFLFCLTFGQFGVIPFLSPSFVANAGLPEKDLPFIYLTGGLVSLVASPTVGRLSDRFGKRKVFLIGALASLGPMIWITRLGPMPEWALLIVSSSFFLVMSGRMVPALALVSTATTPRHRGSFMSLVACVQQIGVSSGSFVSGLIVTQDLTGRLIRYEWVGAQAVLFSLLAVALVFRIRPIEKGAET